MGVRYREWPDPHREANLQVKRRSCSAKSGLLEAARGLLAGPIIAAPSAAVRVLTHGTTVRRISQVLYRRCQSQNEVGTRRNGVRCTLDTAIGDVVRLVGPDKRTSQSAWLRFASGQDQRH